MGLLRLEPHTRTMILRDVWFLLLILACISFAQSVSLCEHDAKTQLIIVALLNLRDETTNCSGISLRGLQQAAVLEKTVSDVNVKDASNEAMSLVLHLIDTCANENGGVTATLKNMVLSHQTCIDPPLVLAFVGPENYEQLQTVRQITTELHKFHVLPFAPNVRRYKEENSVAYIGNNRFQLRSKIILATLNQLKWRSIYAIVGDNMAVPGIFDYLLTELDHLCVTGVAKIPADKSAIKSFYASTIEEFQESGADGLVIFAEDPGHIRHLLRTMDEQTEDRNSSLSVILYLNRVGLKSWELPRNYTFLLLQETSEIKNEFEMKRFTNRTMWTAYREQNNLEYKKNIFIDLLDSTVAPFEYSIHLLWNAAKYARRIKCSLDATTSYSNGVCYDLVYTSPIEWKFFMQKACYFESTSLRKISFEMNSPVVVKIYYIDHITNYPQLIGRVTEIGIIDLSMNLYSSMPSMSKSNPKKCLSTSMKPQEIEIPAINSNTIDNNSNWLAIISRKMKTLVQFNGLISPELNEKINNILCWVIGFFVFISGLVLLTKCVYSIFKVRSLDEEDQANRRKYNRKSRIQSA